MIKIFCYGFSNDEREKIFRELSIRGYRVDDTERRRVYDGDNNEVGQACLVGNKHFRGMVEINTDNKDLERVLDEIMEELK